MTVLDGDRIIIPHGVWSSIVYDLYYDYGVRVKFYDDSYEIPLPEDEKRRDRICDLVATELGLNGQEYDEAIAEARARNREREHEAYLKRKAEEEAAEERRQKELRWKNVSENGCGKCQYKREAKEGDIGFGRGEYTCAVTGEVLKEKNFEGWDMKTGIYYLFNLRAMPSERCPYNTDKEAEHDGQVSGAV